ncbi:coproporphyrinogen-III oxidase family protein [Mycobacterium angelicum]|uniref:Heme chaperone HemW n=1 Tax=Mycobacterium angelicum TaxID=470074 RepID=A0A1W9ZZS4_MYCAN|nr:coproporphyrinogen-III oxidase family protein [Mycobacterium angelicum]MCV7196380.1 coproporphyrinogen III oxidase family protein [Mycobacterium angelicum]ORA23343.1 coproporphyrinogen III oxidase [Mycobacterium angelicum]
MQIDLALKKPTETTAGNYFVGNYPPFSYWNADGAEDAYAALAQPPAAGTPLGVYVHLPFCRRRCHFCYFRVYTGRDAKPDRVTSYLDAVLKESHLYSQTPLLSGRLPRYVYFGGGTPSFLSVPNLTKLFGGLQQHFPWTDTDEIAFEAEPGTLTDDKLYALHDLGVTRLSVGVENFDDDILKVNGRAHLSKDIHRAVEVARKAGFDQINVDLIAGMVNETETNWRECVRKVIDMGPECVTVYQLEVPYNTAIYKEMRANGQIVAPVADWPTKRAWVDYAFSELESVGYTITSGYTAIRDPGVNNFMYREHLWRGADMMALGVSSFGHLGGTHCQNEKDFGPYVDRLARGELPIARGLALTDDDRLIREFILLLKLGQVDPAYFRGKFGVDVCARFAAPLARHQAAGHLEFDDDRVTLTRQGLLRVDELLHEFFRPEHRGPRYV